MNRDEILARARGILAAASIVGEAKVIDHCHDVYQLSTQYRLSAEQKAQIRREWDALMKDQGPAPKLVILERGDILAGVPNKDAVERVDRYTREIAAGRLTVNDVRRLEGLPPI